MKLPRSIRTYPKSFISLALLLGLIVWLMVIPAVKDYQQYRTSMSLIKDIKALKTELETKLGTKLTWDNHCMTPQSKFNASANVWSCVIGFSSNVLYIYDQNIIESTVKSRDFVYNPTTVSPPLKGYWFSYKVSHSNSCGLYFGRTTGFSLNCGLGVDKVYKNKINKELGIETPPPIDAE